MMMAALGMLTVHSISLVRVNKRAARFILGGVAGGFFIFLLEGLNPSSDVIAHIGGFASGLLFGSILALMPAKFAQNKTLDRIAFFFFVTISALVWILALR
jgi:membrane associated rhomboid family serine protease